MDDPGGEHDGAMAWLNEPAEWARDGDALTVRADPGTDFWRTTHYGFIRDNGHCLARPWEGDFVASVLVDGDYRDRYDQAGLMVRLDETTWLKCGVEYVGGVHLASVVVTRDVSDWSVAPLPPDPRDAGAPDCSDRRRPRDPSRDRRCRTGHTPPRLPDCRSQGVGRADGRRSGWGRVPRTLLQPQHRRILIPLGGEPD